MAVISDADIEPLGTDLSTRTYFNTNRNRLSSHWYPSLMAQSGFIGIQGNMMGVATVGY